MSGNPTYRDLSLIRRDVCHHFRAAVSAFRSLHLETRLTQSFTPLDMKGPLQWVLLSVFLGPLLGFAQDSRSIVEILEAETSEHRIGDHGPIYTNLGHEHFAAECE